MGFPRNVFTYLSYSTQFNYEFCLSFLGVVASTYVDDRSDHFLRGQP